MAIIEEVVIAPPVQRPASRRFDNGKSHRNGKDRGFKLHPSYATCKAVWREKRPGEPCEDLPVIVEGRTNATP